MIFRLQQLLLFLPLALGPRLAPAFEPFGERYEAEEAQPEPDTKARERVHEKLRYAHLRLERRLHRRLVRHVHAERQIQVRLGAYELQRTERCVSRADRQRSTLTFVT